jgi:hypothetical protein
MATEQTATREETSVQVRIPLTAEDEAIFDRRHDSMDAQWLYEDADERDAARMLMHTQDRIHWDLASPAVRIAELSL